MSLFRSLLLANQLEEGKKFDYIQDGLAFHLDCTDAEPSSDSNNWQWVDRIGKIHYLMFNCIQNEDKGIAVDFSKNAFGKNIGRTTPPFDDKSYTLEICYTEDVLSNRGGPFVEMGRPYCLGFYFLSNLDIWGTTSSGSKYPKYTRKKGIGKNVLSCNRERGFNNLKKMEGKGVDYYNGNEQPYDVIGYRFKGTIYSIRAYNRLLTEEEMLHNQQVDIDRFFGGVTPQ